MVAGAIEDKAERRPGFAVRRVEPTGFARVLCGHGKCGRIGLEFGPRHLELHDPGIREAHMRRRLVGHLLDHALEHLACAENLRPFERLERGAALDPRAVRRQQRLERLLRLAAIDATNLCRKPVPPARLRLDVGCRVRRGKNAPQARDRLFEAVVGHGYPGPRGLDQRVLREHLPGAGNQQVQQVELARRQCNRLSALRQAARGGIEFERTEREQVSRHAGMIPSTWEGANGVRTGCR
jgi:hypothetical protein